MGVKHSAGRKAFEVGFNQIYKYLNKDRDSHYIKLFNLAHKITGNTYPQYFWDNAVEEFKDPNHKWRKVVDQALDNLHPNVVKQHVLNLGYEAGLTGFKKVKENREKYGCNVPWVILMDPTSACNLKCTGCWAAEYGHQLSLSNELLDQAIFPSRFPSKDPKQPQTTAAGLVYTSPLWMPSIFCINMVCSTAYPYAIPVRTIRQLPPMNS